MKLKGTIYKINTDDEGETKLTFKIPSSHLGSVRELGNFLRKPLELEINIERESV